MYPLRWPYDLDSLLPISSAMVRGTPMSLAAARAFQPWFCKMPFEKPLHVSDTDVLLRYSRFDDDGDSAESTETLNCRCDDQLGDCRSTYP